MLTLEAFFHLAAVDRLVARIAAERAGCVVVAGLDARPLAVGARQQGVLPSGRSTIFRILVREVLTTHPEATCVVVAEEEPLGRLPPDMRGRVHVLPVTAPNTHADLIARTLAAGRPDLLVIDRLSEQTALPALEAAAQGVQVFSQLDTIFRGGQVAGQLAALGVDERCLNHLRWTVTVERLPALCPTCRQPVLPTAHQQGILRQLCPDYEALGRAALAERSPEALPPPGESMPFYAPGSCDRCGGTGRYGDVLLFDIHHVQEGGLLAMEQYAVQLAALGHLSLADVLRFEHGQLLHTYHLLTASETALADLNTRLQQKLAQLESANRVLEERTRALITLQGISHSLLGSTSLTGLGHRVCACVRDLCGADRAILYLLLPGNRAEVLAVSGWQPDHVGRQISLDPAEFSGTAPTPFHAWPPGIPPRHPDLEGGRLRVGLRIPLAAQDQPVGLMIVHSTFKGRFTPGEIALVHAFANQAALAIQRAGLIEALQSKVTQLEAAQIELAKKERLEHELALARQVQQSMLPRTFPRIPGYSFAAGSEPARQVGGDFYDVIRLDDDRFALAIADVSGKGMPAALFMALTRSLLLAEARRTASPAAVLAAVNRLLLELGEPDMFVTIFYGVVEQAAGCLTYSRAGHDRPLLLRDAQAVELQGSGLALGLLEGDRLALSEEQIDLRPGDRLVLYTDGLIDVQAADGRLYDRDRLKNLLQAHSALPPGALCRTVFDHLAAYQGDAEQFDDMTMLILGVSA